MVQGMYHVNVLEYKTTAGALCGREAHPFISASGVVLPMDCVL